MHLKVKEEVENISNILGKVPRALSNTQNTKEVADYLLPFSIGIEFECVQQNSFNVEAFKSIPNIISVNVDKSEQRFRIPAGLEGLICLYDLSIALKNNSLLNPLSGLHYHVDCTSFFPSLNFDVLKKQDWILKELDTWNYSGTYNKRCINLGKFGWVGLRVYFKTLEFRIGEMTFEYELLFKRITHLCRIVSKIKETIVLEQIKKDNPIALYEFNEVKVKEILSNRKVYI
tara:strand:+ start:5861 stop:6553 length:693 start_codon:yes stop_codon:yes gene_type:complete